MKILFVYILAFLISFITNSQVLPQYSKYINDSSWYFSDNTFKYLEDFSLYFNDGAGVSKQNSYIYCNFKSKNDLVDSNYTWKINNETIVGCKKIIWSTYYGNECLSNPYLNLNNQIEFFFKNESLFKLSDSFFVAEKLDMRILFGDSIIYNSNLPLDRHKKQILDPINQVVKIRVLNPGTDYTETTMVVISYGSSHEPLWETIEQDEYSINIIPPNSMPYQFGFIVNRFVHLNPVTTEFEIPKSLISNIPTTDFWIWVIRGKAVKSVTHDQKKVGIYRISKDGMLFFKN